MKHRQNKRRRPTGLAAGLILLASWFTLPGQPAVLSASDSSHRPGRIDLGFSYHNDRETDVPWSIHVLKVDRSNPDLEFHTTVAQGTILGLSSLSDQVKSLPLEIGRPLAAVNGDFYRDDRAYAGDPKGLQISFGELVSAPCDWSCFYMDPAGHPQMTNVTSLFKVVWPNGAENPIGLNEERNGQGAVLYTPRMGPSTHAVGGRELLLERAGDGPWLPLQAGEVYPARVREVHEGGNTALTPGVMVLSLSPQLLSTVPEVKPGALLKISTDTQPSLRGVKTALGGGPALVRDGKIIVTTDGRGRHPRVAIGWNKDFFFMVEVDGRQRGLSVGMNYHELAAYLVKLGCDTAMNLDGGGSATFWVMGQVMNSPSEGHERPMANAFVLVHTEQKATSAPK